MFEGFYIYWLWAVLMYHYNHCIYPITLSILMILMMIDDLTFVAGETVYQETSEDF